MTWSPLSTPSVASPTRPVPPEFLISWSPARTPRSRLPRVSRFTSLFRQAEGPHTSSPDVHVQPATDVAFDDAGQCSFPTGHRRGYPQPRPRMLVIMAPSFRETYILRYQETFRLATRRTVRAGPSLTQKGCLFRLRTQIVTSDALIEASGCWVYRPIL